MVAVVFDPLVPTSDRQYPPHRGWRNDLAEPPGLPSSDLLHRSARLVHVFKACLTTSSQVAGRWRIFGSGSRRPGGLQLDRWRLDRCRSRVPLPEVDLAELARRDRKRREKRERVRYRLGSDGTVQRYPADARVGARQGVEQGAQTAGRPSEGGWSLSAL